ncbi:MAG TPA: PP2C family protein-serine/threonine phosphatase [Terriglobales bacterium]|jgi:sigma-B regulation protein RsbU (phosphoserine phosphatase)|nr:PP2C family protein-serine/threonine phosphatase [Terriglobales bacterium]
MATSPRTSDAAFLRPTRPLRRDQVDELLKLQKAAKKISSILDLDQLIDQIVNDIAISFGCVEANIYLKDDLRQEMVLAGVCGCTMHGKGHGLKIGKEGMVGYVAATGQMRYAPDVSKDAYYMACEPATQSEVAIPLEVDGEVIGVFTASHHELDAFPAEQLRLLQALCSHISVAVHNARRFQKERVEKERINREVQEARAIQEALLPKSPPYIPGFSVAGLSIPAGAVGGDWYDFIALDDERWGLVLADVSGKGPAAALLMSATRGMLRSLAEACCTPGEVLTKLNRLMVEDFPNGKFVTMVYAVLDPATRTLTFASAGHLPPLLVDSSHTRFLNTETGLPLGLTFGSFSEAKIHLPENSKVLFYSDGITEAANAEEEEYGIARLQTHFAQAAACAESILQDVRSFAAPEPLRDDASVIVIKAGT